MEPRGSSVSPLRMRRRITTSAPEQDHSRSGASIGRAECREKKIGIEPKGSFFFLTFPLIGQCYWILHPRNRASQEPDGHRQEWFPGDGTDSQPEALKLLVVSNSWRRNVPPSSKRST